MGRETVHIGLGRSVLREEERPGGVIQEMGGGRTKRREAW